MYVTTRFPRLRRHLVVEVRHARLQPVAKLAALPGHVLPAVLRERPGQLQLAQLLDGLGEYVAVAREQRVGYVVGAVEALVRHAHGAALHRVAPLDLGYHLAHDRLLRLVAGVDRQAQRDALGVEEQAHPHDRVLPSLLGGPLPLQPALEVDLEEEVRAVEVGRRRVAAEQPGHPRVVYLDDLAVLRAQERHAVVELVERVGGVRARELGQDLRVGPELRAGRDRPRAGQVGEQPVQAEPEPARQLQERQVLRHPERLVDGLEREVPQVELRRRVADPALLGGGPGRPPLGVHGVDLRLEVGDGVGDAGLAQLVLVAERPHRGLGRVAPLPLPVALVYLQVEALLVPRLLQEVSHVRALSRNRRAPHIITP